MNKWKIVVILLIALGIISYLLSFLVNDFSTEKIGNKIAIIPIYGAITLNENSNFFDISGTSTNNIIDALKKAEEDPSIKGIILEINSPGGTVVASEEIANAVKKAKKPVVSWIREEGASGAYWIASSSKYVVADPFSITGSIGVIGSYLEFSDLMKKYGISYEQLTSGEYKDTGSPFKKLNDKEKELLQSKINKIHDYFVDEIAKNRNMEKEKVKEIANGAFYLGIEAKELGLVDELGSKDEAVNKAKELADIKDAYLVTYRRKASFFDLFSNSIAYGSFYVGKGISYGLNEQLNNNNFDFKAI